MADKYNFSLILKSAKGHEIGIDTQAKYGYWERPNGAEGGGLWFDSVGASPPSVLELIDYDGSSDISPSIVKALRDAGIVVSVDFE